MKTTTFADYAEQYKNLPKSVLETCRVIRRIKPTFHHAIIITQYLSEILDEPSMEECLIAWANDGLEEKPTFEDFI